jgi:catechol 2,3-dioxygenase-like lactoylglutathione lyase family enzyme
MTRAATAFATNRPQRAVLTVALLLSGIGGSGRLWAQDGRTLDGIAHVALRVSDIARSRAFYKTLGWQPAFEFSDDQGVTTSYVKVSDRQFIELYRGTGPSDPIGFMHICLDTADLERLSAAYTALGLTPTQPKKGRSGNVLFNLRDPEGHVIEYTQYLPGSLHSNARGRFVDEARISGHLISVVLRVTDVDSERAFFTGKLGFAGNEHAYKLAVPGNPAETIELKARAANAPLELGFAADPKRAAEELKKRGLEVKLADGVAEVRDPDGTVVCFSER